MYWLGLKPITYGFDMFFLHLDALMGDDIAKESHLILMKTALLKVCVQWVLLQLVQHPSNDLDVLFVFVLGVDKDVIEVHYDKNVKLFYQDLIDITLECGRCVSQSKGHHLVLEMAIAGPEGRLPFVSFPNPYSMVGIGQIELGETSSRTSQSNDSLTKGQGIPILNYQVIETSLIHA